jgi:ferritin
MKDRDLGQFLNWFIRHYSTETTTDRGLLYYANAMGEEVSIAEILEHYKREK